MVKALSLKLDEGTYRATEKIRKRLKLPRNAYIRKAIGHYNALHDRKLLERDYREASCRLGAAHLRYLRETELLDDLGDRQPPAPQARAASRSVSQRTSS